MKLLDPFAITTSTLTSSNVPETVAEYDGGATYAKGNIVRDEESHTLFESQDDGNTGHPLDDPAWWVDIGPTNRHAMFDQKLGTITYLAEEIDVTFTCPGRVTGIALFRLEAATVQVTITDDVDGEVFDETFDLISHDNVEDIYDYFYAPILRRRNYFIEGLPMYSGAQVRVRIVNPGAMVECGNLVPGTVVEFGTTVTGASVGIIDYSTKEADADFGTVELVERDYRVPATFRDALNPVLVDEVHRVLTDRRAKPTVFIGSKIHSSMMIFGFAKDWEITVERGIAYLNAQLESLT